MTLTRKETGILEYLMVHQGRPVSQEELMDHVWDNSVDSFCAPSCRNQLVAEPVQPLNDKLPFLPVQFHIVFLLHTLFLL